jgi:membrane protease YdiL (CAAX protease family)
MTPTPPTPPFTQPKVRSLIAVFLIATVLIGVGLAALQTVTAMNVEDPLWVMGLYIVLFVGISLWLRQSLRHHGVQIPAVIGELPTHPRWLGVGGLVIASLVFSLSAFVLSTSLLASIAPDFVENLLQQVAAEANPRTINPGLYQVVMAIATIIIAPITEEFIFRGFILQRWAVKWNLPLALIVSSIFFGIMHLNPVGLTVFGLLMGLLYIKTRSLVIPIAAHAFNNLLANLAMFLPQETNPSTLKALQSSLPLSIILIVFSAPWLVWFIRRSWPRRDAPIPYEINIEKHPL